MRVVALIPARYNSTRFPFKMLAKLGGKALIRQTYEMAVRFEIFDDVYVVTDNEKIFDEITNNGGKALKSIREHETGTDRIAEAAEQISADIIFNIQGDEPFLKAEPLKMLIDSFQDETVDVATLMQRIDNPEDIENPNFVKLVKDLNNFVMYFSRSPIPYNRDGSNDCIYYQHIGVYAFRKDALLKFSKLPATPNELAEKIEPIRLLENGMKIKVFETKYIGIKIDTEEELVQANNYLKLQDTKIP